jgi:hypothetical protein
MKTLQEIEKAIEALPLPDRLRLYKDMPHVVKGLESDTVSSL